jgi:molybdopterin converting factor small subunit
MKIQVEFLSLPQITRITGNRSITFNLQGSTIRDLIREISATYGREIGQFLMDESGHLDAVFKVQLNKSEWITKNHLDTSLKNGDTVTFMMLVGGG